MYLYQLRKLLGQAMANMDDIVRETLLLHKFVVGLPIPISRHIRAAGETSKIKFRRGSNKNTDDNRGAMFEDCSCL